MARKTTKKAQIDDVIEQANAAHGADSEEA